MDFTIFFQFLLDSVLANSMFPQKQPGRTLSSSIPFSIPVSKTAREFLSKLNMLPRGGGLFRGAETVGARCA